MEWMRGCCGRESEREKMMDLQHSLWHEKEDQAWVAFYAIHQRLHRKRCTICGLQLWRTQADTVFPCSSDSSRRVHKHEPLETCQRTRSPVVVYKQRALVEEQEQADIALVCLLDPPVTYPRVRDPLSPLRLQHRSSSSSSFPSLPLPMDTSTNSLSSSLHHHHHHTPRRCCCWLLLCCKLEKPPNFEIC